MGMGHYFGTNPKSGLQHDAYMHIATGGDRAGLFVHRPLSQAIDDPQHAPRSIYTQAAYEPNSIGFSFRENNLQDDALSHGDSFNVSANTIPSAPSYAGHISDTNDLLYGLAPFDLPRQDFGYGLDSAVFYNSWTSPLHTGTLPGQNLITHGFPPLTGNIYDDRLNYSGAPAYNSIMPSAGSLLPNGFSSSGPPPPLAPGNHTYTSLASAPPANPKPRYPCLHPRCSKTFSRSSDLARHISKHRGDAPKFYCGVEGCKFSGERGFYRRDKLASHVRNVHAG